MGWKSIQTHMILVEHPISSQHTHLPVPHLETPTTLRLGIGPRRASTVALRRTTRLAGGTGRVASCEERGNPCGRRRWSASFRGEKTTVTRRAKPEWLDSIEGVETRNMACNMESGLHRISGKV